MVVTIKFIRGSCTCSSHPILSIIPMVYPLGSRSMYDEKQDQNNTACKYGVHVSNTWCIYIYMVSTFKCVQT